jgi:hypothetical protein
MEKHIPKNIDEYISAVKKYGKQHLSIIGVVGGMLLIALSLFFFI